MRVCCRCERALGRHELLEPESGEMEAARQAGGLEGLRFLYYNCPRCGHDNVFLEVMQLPGETGHDFHGRREALTQDIQEVRGLQTTILVVEASMT